MVVTGGYTNEARGLVSLGDARLRVLSAARISFSPSGGGLALWVTPLPPQVRVVQG